MNKSKRQPDTLLAKTLRKGRTLWRVVGVGTSQGTLNWCGTLPALEKNGDVSRDTHNIPWSSLDLKALLLVPLFFILSPRITIFCHCSSTMTKDHLCLYLMALNNICVSMCL